MLIQSKWVAYQRKHRTVNPPQVDRTTGPKFVNPPQVDRTGPKFVNPPQVDQTTGPKFAKPPKVDRHLTDMADQFPEPISSRWALLITGDMALREGLPSIVTDREVSIRKLEKAKRLYQQVVESKFIKTPMLQRRALFGLAYTMESLGEFDEAAKYYSQLIEEGFELADAAKRGLARTQDEELRIFFEVFSKAPALETPLPRRPDIDFPEPLPSDPESETER